MNTENTKDSNQNVLEFLKNKFFPFWPLIVLFLLVSLLFSTVYIYSSKKIYEASAALLINDEVKGGNDSEMIESINYFKTKKIVENELEILTSRELIKQVVLNLNLYSPVFKKFFLKRDLEYQIAPVNVLLKNPYNAFTYQDQEDFDVVYNFEKNEIVLDNENFPLDEWVKVRDSIDLKFSKNSKWTKADENQIEFSFRLVDPRIIADYIHYNLSAESSSKLATVVRLSFKSESPLKAEEFLTELINVYKLSEFSERDEIAQSTLNFIDLRMEEVENELKGVEKELETYRAKEGVIDLSKQGNLYLQNVGDYDRRLTDIDIQLSILNSIKSYVNAKGNKSGIVPSTMGVSDPILSQLLKDLYEAEMDYERLKRTTAENNPILISITNRMDKIRPSILEIVKNQLSNLVSSKNNLISSSDKYSNALKILPEQERKLVDITRRKENVSDLYDYLVKKREETALSYAPTNSDVKVIETAQASLRPVSPKKPVIYLMAIFLSLGLSMAVILGREIISSKILFRTDLERLTSLPIIGELVHVDNGISDGQTSQEINYFNQLKFWFKEKYWSFYRKIFKSSTSFSYEKDDIYVLDQFRHLLVHLGFYNRDKAIKKLLVTSSIQGEGKSYVSENLADILSFSGKKIVLLDMDLRNRTISHKYHLENDNGIVEYLNDIENYDNLLKKVGKQNLYIIPAGSKSTNSSELLTSAKLDELIARLEIDFDHIIFDTPPVNMVSDALILNHFCDKSLFVVRHGFTPKFLAQRLDELANKNKLKNCSLVFNGVKSRGLVNGEIAYGYGYESNN